MAVASEISDVASGRATLLRRGTLLHREKAIDRRLSAASMKATGNANVIENVKAIGNESVSEIAIDRARVIAHSGTLSRSPTIE